MTKADQIKRLEKVLMESYGDHDKLDDALQELLVGARHFCDEYGLVFGKITADAAIEYDNQKRAERKSNVPPETLFDKE